MPGIQTSDASFTSSSSASIHTVPAIEPTEFDDTGVVDVGDEATVVVVVVEVVVVVATGVVNERITPLADPLVLVIATRK